MVSGQEKEEVAAKLRPIIPYPTGRFFRGTLSQALRARLRSVLSLRDALADISQQALARLARSRQDRRVWYSCDIFNDIPYQGRSHALFRATPVTRLGRSLALPFAEPRPTRGGTS